MQAYRIPKATAYLTDCTLCPRKCHVNRLAGERGFCGQAADIYAARAALHYWEEPCISGEEGSGAVFFSGCNLKCVFCQNHDIAVGKQGGPVSIEHLSEIFLNLQSQGANNINLVTATHFVPQICDALRIAKSGGLSIPIVYNSSGYEEINTLHMLSGLVDIYLPDLKYYSQELSSAYSHAPDYFSVASKAISEMLHQVGCPTFDSSTGLMKKGVIVRHLVLPGQIKDSKKVLRYLHTTFGNDIYVSIMNQYTPLPHVSSYAELNRKVTADEYDRVLKFAEAIGIEQGFLQEGETAMESFIPAFNGEGL